MGGGEPPKIPPRPAPPKPDPPKTICSICFEQFTRRKRVPISLVCGHTFCAACIRGHARARSDEGLSAQYSIECGVCRALTFAPTNNLRKNVMLLEYMEEKGDLADSDGEGEEYGGERENVNTGQMVGGNGENQPENNANTNNLNLEGHHQRFGGGGERRNFLLELLRQFDAAERAIAGVGVGGGGPSPHRLQQLDQFRAEIADMRWDVDRQIQELFQFLMDRFFVDDRFLFADKRQRMNAILEHINEIIGQQPLNNNAPGAQSSQPSTFSGAPFVVNFNALPALYFPYPMMLVLMTFGDFQQLTQMPPPPQSQHHYPSPPPQWPSSTAAPSEGGASFNSAPQGTAGGRWQGRNSPFDRGAPPPNVVPQNNQQQQYRWQPLNQNPENSGTTFTAAAANPSSFTVWRESETNDDNDDDDVDESPLSCPQPSSNFSTSSSSATAVGNNADIFSAGRRTLGNPLVPMTPSTYHPLSSGNPFGALNNNNDEEEEEQRGAAAGLHFRGGGDFRYTSRGLGGGGLRRRPPSPSD